MGVTKPGTKQKRWTLIMALAPAVILVPMFAIDLLEGGPRIGGAGMAWIALCSLGGGIWCLRDAYREYQAMAQYRDVPTSTVRSLAVGDVEIEGLGHPVAGTVANPLGGPDLLAYRLDVETWEPDSDGGNWVREALYRAEVPFELDDDTGRVLVEARGAELAADVRTIQLERGQTPPQALFDLRERVAADPEGSQAQGVPRVTEAESAPRHHLTGEAWMPRRYRLRGIPAGERLYVYGRAEPAAEAEGPRNEARLVVGEPHAGTFTLAHGSEEQLVAGSRRTVKTLAAAGFVVVPVAATALLYWLHVF